MRSFARLGGGKDGKLAHQAGVLTSWEIVTVEPPQVSLEG